MMIAKYSASGNDFVIYHSFIKRDRSDAARMLCNRQEGIGADGLIVLVPHADYDFEWQFYNADGSEAEMCGNGSRACAHYAFSRGLAPERMRFLTIAGEIRAVVEGDMVQSDLTPPKVIDTTIDENGVHWWLLDTGVPHLVSLRDDITRFDIDEARRLRNRYNANVNIATVDENGELHVRTYERGVEDETLACGTGMAAAFYRAKEERLCGEHTRVYPRSGETLYLGFEAGTITFRGSVRETFETSWRENVL